MNASISFQKITKKLLFCVFAVGKTWGLMMVETTFNLKSTVEVVPSLPTSGPIIKVQDGSKAHEKDPFHIRLESYEKRGRQTSDDLIGYFSVSWKQVAEEEWQEGRLVPSDENSSNKWELQQISKSLKNWEHRMDFQLDENTDILQLALQHSYPQRQRGRHLAASEAAPHWPQQILSSLTNSGLHGSGTIVFDAERFLHILAVSCPSGPIIFPSGSFKLELELEKAISTLQVAFGTASSVKGFLKFIGHKKLKRLSGGRLVGKLPTEELVQIGDDLSQGLLATTSKIQVVDFMEGSLGLSLCPITKEETGAEVMEVEKGGQADMLGVQEGWVFKKINGVDVSDLEFSEIDAEFDLPPPWKVEFDTACTAERLYAVEIPAEECMQVLGRKEENLCDVGGKLTTRLKKAPVLWKEEYSRLFVGDPGSTTSLHVDLVPQLEFCHVVEGTKLLGTATREATPDLLRQHVQEKDEMCETKIPVHTELSPSENALLKHPGMSIAMGLPGDILVFGSGSAHFATNGANGISAALYHGMVTPASIPQMCQSLDPFTEDERMGRFGNHLSGMDILQGGLPSQKDLWQELNKYTENRWVVPKCKRGMKVARRLFFESIENMEEAVLLSSSSL
mmetsp:Transcript_41286/g.53230  ORF Transcript_41286/g.53230 Transcript_41286/m.53230 type:complete len:622 (-) Transcript_41286:233-2098(-)